MLTEVTMLNDHTATTGTIDVADVPDTMLWPLWSRAAEQKCSDKLIDDPLAAELVERIDYDFRGTFGAPSVSHVIRSRVGDDLVTEYADNCDGERVVVNLGDGLETQPWRIADKRISWISVDSPEAIAARRRLLPPHSRSRCVPCSPLDPAWIREIPSHSMPFVSATGLLMYLKTEEVVRLLATIADHFPKAIIYFDTIPASSSPRTPKGLKVTRKYTTPAMPWGISIDEIPEFLNAIPGVKSDRVWNYTDPYPCQARRYNWLSRVWPLNRRHTGALVVARAYRKTALNYRG